MSGSQFWRGFFPLLATMALGQAILQIDIIMAARTGAGALSAYALLLRVAVLDMVATTALATVAAFICSAIAASTPLSRAARMSMSLPG